MNDTELDELLNTWKVPAAPRSLRESVRTALQAKAERRRKRWIAVLVPAVLGMAALLLFVTPAIPQRMGLTAPPVKHPYLVDSEFVRYSKDGSPAIDMYSTSYNDQYGREILLSRHIPDNPVHDAIARLLDAAGDATAPIRFRLLRLSPGGSEMVDKMAAAAPRPAVNTQCADEKCITGVGHFSLPMAAANPGIGCADGKIVDRETILGYPTVAIQLPLDGNRVRRTVWMAPALECFALKVATEKQQADGTFGLVSGKQALAVRLNP
ncbi:MAG TPA: hypothetical protein VK752_27955 [Bryobacteraceae bacterium]|jgi:hypothetical protein|nr:hypothetical protein [Bryobacteraceae bacterium]